MHTLRAGSRDAAARCEVIFTPIAAPANPMRHGTRVSLYLIEHGQRALQWWPLQQHIAPFVSSPLIWCYQYPVSILLFTLHPPIPFAVFFSERVEST